VTVAHGSRNLKKLLFFAEGATLAHVVRPLLLAKALDLTLFDITFCRPRAFLNITDPLPFRTIDLKCQDGKIFVNRLERGVPLYDFPTLEDYVRDDLSIIDDVQPDVIIGDFRLSLSVSARLKKVPYITLCDAYWSPEYTVDAPLLPVLSATSLIPTGIAQWAFRRIAPMAFRLHSMPMEKLRRHFGLPPLNHDLRACYTDADLRLFANPQPLFPEIITTSNAAFIGPIAWSPTCELKPPANFNTKPLIYVTMGSSGSPGVITKILPAIKELDCYALIATAGRKVDLRGTTEQFRVSDFFPGNLACQMADLVICNGGSPTTNQALNAGKPVIGIAQNMDQFLNMQAIERHGSGSLIRADNISTKSMTRAIDDLLQTPKFRQQANNLKNLNPTEQAVNVLTRHILALSNRE
jgi:UDP:flavonoid glycosyltransferase YjiC (YdhE family)